MNPSGLRHIHDFHMTRRKYLSLYKFSSQIHYQSNEFYNEVLTLKELLYIVTIPLVTSSSIISFTK